LGREHLNTLMLLSNMTGLLANMGRWGEEKRYLERCVIVLGQYLEETILIQLQYILTEIADGSVRKSRASLCRKYSSWSKNYRRV